MGVPGPPRERPRRQDLEPTGGRNEDVQDKMCRTKICAAQGAPPRTTRSGRTVTCGAARRARRPSGLLIWLRGSVSWLSLVTLPRSAGLGLDVFCL